MMAETQTERKRDSWGEIVRTIAGALLIALIFRVFLFQPFNIPSGSMKPTLLIGDFLFVSKYSYGYSRYSFPFSPDLFEGRIWEGEPKRGDIIVFRGVNNDKQDFIKRLIGLPGDRIQMRAGRLYINGELVERKPDGVFENHFPSRPYSARCDPDRVRRVADGYICRADQYIETLPNGVSYTILEASRSNGNDDTREFLVPADSYFFMGDNRDDSNDSRAGLGFIPESHLIGRAEVIFLSAEGTVFLPWNWRFDRLFSGIN